jgi:hypothetical protein
MSDPITDIDLKFKSGNDVEVKDVRITKSDWEEVVAYVDMLEARIESLVNGE